MSKYEQIWIKADKTLILKDAQKVHQKAYFNEEIQIVDCEEN